MTAIIQIPIGITHDVVRPDVHAPPRDGTLFVLDQASAESVRIPFTRSQWASRVASF